MLGRGLGQGGFDESCSWPGGRAGTGAGQDGGGSRNCICECPLCPQSQDGSLPLVLTELLQSCSMVME